ncbi:efflux RND transporter periplasmic adaptor subunit [Cellvibrio sp. KY-YJ-3]|uniref:efflux RND transporter periplasmic adaptor subunit n=1 Tax=Cellvibrio sp. KY-YJ-3 TaxID=454662 RepID=UPI0017829DBB|nr:HlyD family efflux transporter periplasmic adaptor subunit [Cellvibrio sp. KY-YJ-3]
MTMDIPRQLNFWQKWRRTISAVILFVTLAALWVMAAPSSERTLRVNKNDLVIASVQQGIFEDVIPLRGEVMPLRTLYLDAIEGGRVEKIHVEDGATIAAGAAIVDISNTRLQLESITREAQVSEQINLLQTQELNLARNDLEHKRNLNELDHQITTESQRLERMRPLIKHQLISAAELKEAEDNLVYLKKRQQLIREAREVDLALQAAQMKQLRDSVTSLNNNLTFARTNLASLNVTAPIAGRLTAFNLEPGQSLMPGERFGQIDDPDYFKLMAQVDEFYMNRTRVDQTALAKINQQEFPLRIKKIYPQVIDGQFRVDLVFTGEQPANISRGQTLQLRLQMGANEPAQLIPNNSFFQDTGGHWIFVVSADGKRAYRRDIKLGRRNSQFIEVLAGLDPNEQVIVSPYTTYNDIDSLKIQ